MDSAVKTKQSKHTKKKKRTLGEIVRLLLKHLIIISFAFFIAFYLDGFNVF